MGRGTTDAPRPAALTTTAVVAAIVAAGACVAPASASGHRSDRAAGDAVSISTSVSPRAVFFGDRLTAAVDVRVRTTRVDPQSVSIEASFRPYTTLGRPSLERSGDSIRLRATLTCLTAACAPKTPERRVVLEPVRVRYRDGARSLTASRGWPSELVASRLVAQDRRHQALRTRLQPPPTARADTTTGWALIGVAALLLVVAAALVGLQLLTRAAAGGEAGSRELDRAIAEVERLAREDEARRSAVDRLASALADAGLEDVAPQARALAWSRPPPAAEPMRRLVERIERLTRRAT